MKSSSSVKNRRIVLLTLAATALLFVLADQAAAQTRNKESISNPILTEQQAQALPESSKVAMVCAKCKTVQLATEKKNFLTWLARRPSTFVQDVVDTGFTRNAALKD